jgi:ligand-binding sensor domain-containing protein
MNRFFFSALLFSCSFSLSAQFEQGRMLFPGEKGSLETTVLPSQDFMVGIDAERFQTLNGHSFVDKTLFCNINGEMCFAAENGRLMSFNGADWANGQVLHRPASEGLFDAEGNFWGVTEQDGRQVLFKQDLADRTTVFTPENSGLVAGAVNLRLGAGNTLWLQTDEFTLQTFDGARWNTFVLEERIVAYFPSRQETGTAWAVTDKGQLFQWESELLIDHTPFIAETVGETAVQTVCGDARGNVWAFGLQGLYRYDGTRWSNCSANGIPVAERGSTVVANPAGQLWFVEKGRGRLIGFDPVRQQTVAAYESGKGQLELIGQDRLGLLWFGENNAKAALSALKYWPLQMAIADRSAQMTSTDGAPRTDLGGERKK